eukprot:164158_1
MRHFSQQLKGLDRFIYLAVGGLGTFAFYHYQKRYELSNVHMIKNAEHEYESMILKLKESSIPSPPIYNVNLNRQNLEYKYAQFILDSTLNQIKSVINVATGPKNSGKSTIFIKSAQIIQKAMLNKTNNEININWKALERYSDFHILYLNLEQGFRTALKLQFGVNSESETEALTLLSIVIGSTIKENKGILLLIDSIGDIQNHACLKNQFCRMLKNLCDSGYCYIFCLSSPDGVTTFDHDILNNGRKYVFEDDRFVLNEKEKIALIGACYNYDGNVMCVESHESKIQLETMGEDTIEELYDSMRDDDMVQTGIIGDLLSYLNQTYSTSTFQECPALK